MKLRYAALAAGFVLAASTSWGIDAIKMVSGPAVTGTVTSVSPTEVVVVEKKGAAPRRVPVNEMVFIRFEDDPSSLRTARDDYTTNGKYEQAITVLDKITVGANLRPEIQADVDFYAGYCRAQIALAGSGDVMAAARAINSFLKKHKTSYHWYKAQELFGDLAVANGSYAAAKKAYAEVASAPWPDYKMRAGLALGRAALAEQQPAEAAKAFESVLAMKADSAAAKNLQQAANLGSARILAMQKKPDEAVKLVQPIIDKLEAAKSDADVSDLLGSAYATRAFAQRAAGRNKEALYDFLRVHLLYNGAPDPHAEALYNLGQLWDQFHSPDRAKKARQTLLEQYKNTPWAKN